MNVHSCVHTNIYFWILWSERGSSPVKVVTHYFLKLKSHICLYHKDFKHFIPCNVLQCVLC